MFHISVAKMRHHAQRRRRNPDRGDCEQQRRHRGVTEPHRLSCDSSDIYKNGDGIWMRIWNSTSKKGRGKQLMISSSHEVYRGILHLLYDS